MRCRSQTLLGATESDTLYKPDAQDVTSKVKGVERDDAIFLVELTEVEGAPVEYHNQPCYGFFYGYFYGFQIGKAVVVATQWPRGLSYSPSNGGSSPNVSSKSQLADRIGLPLKATHRSSAFP